MQDDLTSYLTPKAAPTQFFTDAAEAVAALDVLYTEATDFLITAFSDVVKHGKPARRIRAFYPEIRLSVTSHDKIDSRLAFGHVAKPGVYSTSITRPDLFGNYLIQQLGLLLQNHGVPVQIGPSDTPIPVHFAVAGRSELSVPQEGSLDFSLRDVFDGGHTPM